MVDLKWEGKPLDVQPSQWYTVMVPTVRAVLLDEASNPVVGQECVITGANGFRVRAVTDARGRVSVPAPVGEYEISYTALDEEVWAATTPPAETTAGEPASETST